MSSLTTTINADKRYYLSEDNLEGGENLLHTIGLFNDYKMDLYNALFDKRFFKTGPLVNQAYSKYLKEKYSVNAYYACAIYPAASGVLSSQVELRKLNLQSLEEQIKAKERKIKSTQEELERNQKIKRSIVTYAKTGRWAKPYPECKLKVSGQTIITYQKKRIALCDYERAVEAKIRDLKRKLSNLKFGLERAKAKYEKTKKKIGKIVFGAKDFYRKKDRPETDMSLWKKEFNLKRHHSMSLPGRHTSKSGNFLAIYDPTEKTLTVHCMNGKTCVFKNFQLARYQAEFLDKFGRDSNRREAICYNFCIEQDQYGRTYIIPSVTMELPPKDEISGFSTGCVSMDLNVDHIAVSDLDAEGNRLGGFIVPFDLKGKPSGQISDIIGRAMSMVGAFCQEKMKCLVMEDIDTTKSKSGLQYGNKLRNRKISSFAYKKMTKSAMNQGYKRNFAVYKISPEYTSQIGKIKYMRRLGLSIHESASYVIGLVGMGKFDKLTLPVELEELLPASTPKELKKQWATVTRAFSGIRTHAFYLQITEKDWSKRKKKELKNYAAILKEKDNPMPILSKSKTSI